MKNQTSPSKLCSGGNLADVIHEVGPGHRQFEGEHDESN
jgi:hypothetical protein